MIKKSYIFVGVLLLSASSVVANTEYDCKRKFLTTEGFSSRAVADSWFPEEGWIVYSADGKRSATFMGISEKRAKVHREYGMSTVRRQGGLTIDFRHEDFDRDKSVLRVTMTEPGYKTTNATLYDCGPAGETDWWPEED
jgi:hypothetical protein